MNLRSSLCGLLIGIAFAPTLPTSAATSALEPLRIVARPRQAFLDTLEARTFAWFWEQSDSTTGLTPDRWPTKSFVSVSAVGFALTAYPVGVESGYVTREAAAARVWNTLRFFRDAPSDTSLSESIGVHGFFYHFLVPETGLRFADVELSTVDTALFLAGALFCQSYFDQPIAIEDSIRTAAETLYRRADWNWAQPRPPSIVHGWKPESGFLPYDWGGYNETMLLHILALGSPTHPVPYATWEHFQSGYKWGDYMGQEHLGFSPLFGHQYSHVWIDFRGIQDAYMRERGLDYFENSRRATLSQRAYAIANPNGLAGYDSTQWGLSACDGPLDRTLEIDGRSREFHTYWARGASFHWVNDDGTIAPTAAAGSLPFAPEIVIPTLLSMRARHGSRLFGEYGFKDAFNPTLNVSVETQHGAVLGESGWYDSDYLGIDQGPILAMIANYRSDLVWKTMRRNPHVVRGLRAAGFEGGWLDAAPGAR